MRKFTLTSTRLGDFNNMADCFYQLLDANKVVDTGEAGLTLPTGASNARTSSAANTPNSVGAASNVPRTDGELQDLQQELAKTKTSLREEIATERAKADQIKSNLSAEVSRCSRASL